MGKKQHSARYQKLISLRVTDQEKDRLSEQAGMAGISVSEYMRRKFFGGRPVVAHTDMTTLRELRRIGGLLKHHFETLRQAGASREHLEQQEETLRILGRAVERLGKEG